MAIQGDHIPEPPVDLVPTAPAAAGLLLTAQAGWQNITNLSQLEVLSDQNGHLVFGV